MSSVYTSGDDAACSAHALLGRPACGKLFCENARERLANAFARAQADDKVKPLYENMLNGWWGELCTALNTNKEEEEDVGVLWRTFSETLKESCRHAAKEVLT